MPTSDMRQGAAPDACERCPDEIEIASYLDGMMDSAQLERMRAHLALCGKCAKTVEELRELLAAAGSEASEDAEALRQMAEKAKKLVSE